MDHEPEKNQPKALGTNTKQMKEPLVELQGDPHGFAESLDDPEQADDLERQQDA